MTKRAKRPPVMQLFATMGANNGPPVMQLYVQEDNSSRVRYGSTQIPASLFRRGKLTETPISIPIQW